MDLHEKTGVAAIPKFLDGISINENDQLALVASNLTGKLWDGVVTVFNNVNFAPHIPHIDHGSLNESGCTSVKWIDLNNIVTSTDDGTVEVWKVNDTPNLEASIIFAEHNDVCSSVSVLNQTKQLVSGSWDGSIKIWNLENEQALHTIMYHTDKVLDVAWDTNSVNVFASASEDGTVQIHDNRNEGKPDCLWFYNPINHPTCLTWKNGNCVIAGFSNGDISLLDLRYSCSSPLKNFTAHKKTVNKLVYVDSLIISASDDFSVKMYDDLKCVYENVRHLDYVKGLAYQESSKSIWSCGWDGVLFEHKVLL
ncbi:methylosome protein WDR77-like [Hydra vulgaris]|uniref:Methylosome protein WDR77-like n=1 Tax=Hydra vulgaris TaxID=6087 RepID=A0ABM4DDJ6_HYDVU